MRVKGRWRIVAMPGDEADNSGCKWLKKQVAEQKAENSSSQDPDQR